DLQILGQRHKDIKNQMTAPPKLTLKNIMNMATKPKWCLGMMGTKRHGFANIVGHASGVKNLTSLSEWSANNLLRTLNWDDLDWMIKRWGGKVILKGIQDVEDADTIETELMLADLENIEKRMQGLIRKIKGGDKDAVMQNDLLKRAKDALEAGKPARTCQIEIDEEKQWRLLTLLTAKPILYVCNVEEDNAGNGNAHSDAVAKMASDQGAVSVVISAAIEEEISQLETEEAKMFLNELGLEEAGLDRLIAAGYGLLGLQTYFTVGPKEARAWTIRKNTSAPQAAGVIHGDFERGFIRAETIAYEDYIDCNGEQGAKEKGKMRAEGKTYMVSDGDVLHFLFNT
ncbi:DUF933 domain-containing protein, partial [Amylibacter sp.]|nr:DUF933 domain-containing protein [Amylibacter sp.]